MKKQIERRRSQMVYPKAPLKSYSLLNGILLRLNKSELQTSYTQICPNSSSIMKSKNGFGRGPTSQDTHTGMTHDGLYWAEFTDTTHHTLDAVCVYWIENKDELEKIKASLSVCAKCGESLEVAPHTFEYCPQTVE
jgi:hypothetical protein